MLTRIRIEAEGPTVSAVQDDLFATYDALCQVVYGPEIVPAFRLDQEVIESAEPPEFHSRWYRGRAIVAFPTGEQWDIGAERLRPRIEWLADQDRKASTGNQGSGGATVGTWTPENL